MSGLFRHSNLFQTIIYPQNYAWCAGCNSLYQHYQLPATHALSHSQQLAMLTLSQSQETYLMAWVSETFTHFPQQVKALFVRGQWHLQSFKTSRTI